MLRKLKVMHVTYDMRIGGTEQVIKNLIESSDHTQFDMSVCCIEKPLGPFGEQLREQGVEIYQAHRQPGFDTKLIGSIRYLVKRHNIDVVHCHQYTPYVYGVIAAIGLSAKVVFTEHGRFYPDFGTWKRKLINPVLHFFTGATTAISSATRDALGIYENLPVKDIEVIYNGIKPVDVDSQEIKALTAELGIQEGELVLGTVARFDPIKNHQMMIKAFADVAKEVSNIKLLIVGDGEEKENIVNLINQLALNDKVILTGYVPKPFRHIALMDIYLLSSFSEGTSMTLLEAMSFSKPCVVTNVGGNPEIILHQKTGLVSGNDDQKGFSKNMLALINDTSLRKAYGQNALLDYQQRLTSAAMAHEYATVYQRLCHQIF